MPSGYGILSYEDAPVAVSNGDGTVTVEIGAPEGKVILSAGAYLRVKNHSAQGGFPHFQAVFPLIASFPVTSSTWRCVFAGPMIDSPLANYIVANVHAVYAD